ncbi:MAG TPA: alpha,alpha-trehalase TreA [Cyclobacteriaceae bacterium]|nr:alpha,alpha-trehalase TreA [Cyclobacteriaceae bacterium]
MKTEIFQLDEFFRDVQMSNVFEDGKTFPDCIPRRSLEEIESNYLLRRGKPGFDLRKFIQENFTEPQAYTSGYKSDTSRSVAQHIESLWNELTRNPEQQSGTLISLPFPYIVPGGRFREIYYWDSFFTMLGLQVSGRIEMIRNMIDNFSYLIDSVGFIPNGNRTYFSGRSQPPFFSCMVKLLSKHDSAALVNYLPQLEKEYTFWMKGSTSLSESNSSVGRVVRMPDGSILNRYWDAYDTPRPESYKEDVELAHRSQNKGELFRNIRAAAESGWDFSTRWFKDVKSFESIHTTDIIPVDLNCLLLHLEEVLSEAWKKSGNTTKSAEYAALAEKRKTSIMKYCWNSKENFFFDYDFVNQVQKNYLTLAGAFPLYFKIATNEHAKGVAQVLEKDFLKQGGFVTTREFSGQQWDAPNGWAPLQWIVYKGLKNYRQVQLANEGKKRWLSLVDGVYHQTGKMMEKYNVTDTTLAGGGGEYPNQDGFGWTNGVTAAFLSDAK